MNKLVLLFLYVIIPFSFANAQSFGMVDYKLGVSSLSSRYSSYSSFYTGAGLSYYLTLKNKMLLSIGFNFGSNAIYESDNPISYSNSASFNNDDGNGEETEEDSMDFSILGYMFFNVGNVQFPIKIGKLLFNKSENIGCLLSAGFVPEILLSKEFNYTDYYFRMKNSLGMGIIADVGLLFRMGNDNYFITSLSYNRLISRYTDNLSGQDFTRWSLSLNLGVVMRF